VLRLVQDLGLDPARVAVELDRRILKRPLWAESVLNSDAQIEIVQFVGGG
jgi:thiamine biosynthesis protein ThiS